MTTAQKPQRASAVNYGPSLNRHDLANAAAILADHTRELDGIAMPPLGRFWYIYDALCATQRRRDAEEGGPA